ncbi:MAG: MmcQ/YjbR family DNA-binding protein [Thermomicrobiales bacterium]
MHNDPLDRLRAICLTLPEATEKVTWGDVPTFRVRDKISTMQHNVDGRTALWCKAPPGAQDAFVGSDPKRFFVPPYVGHHGWIGVWLDRELDWDEIAALIEDGYRMTAPKRLVALLARD